MFARGGQVVLAWREFDGRQYRVLAQQSADRGITWSSVREVAVAAKSADLPLFVAGARTPLLCVVRGWRGAPLRAWGDAMIRRLLLLCALFLAVPAVASEPAVRPFVAGSLAQITAARQGKPFVLAFWSVGCTHRPAELKTLGN